MTNVEKIKSLKEIINSQISPFIDRDYYLLEVPYYENVGDTLIWQGEIDFLKTLPYKCKGMYSQETFPFPDINQDDLILFQGGGNFGDIWIDHQNFRLKVISHYPNNRFILFPQTVYFENDGNMQECSRFLASFPNVIICARDNWSYQYLKDNFKNDVLLVPDMAFYIDISHNLIKYCKRETEDSLLLKRTDKELRESSTLVGIEQISDISISDWPSYSVNRPLANRLLRKIMGMKRGRRIALDLYVKQIYRRYLICTGVRLISRYHSIYSTRLHASILGILLNKEVHILDNSYGKNRNFYNTWLSDLDTVSMID